MTFLRMTVSPRKNNSKLLAALFTGLTFCLTAPTVFCSTPSAKDAKVYIVSPKNGDTVSSPVTVIFGLAGMGIAPAGIKKENTGHHHLVVDGKIPENLSKAMEKDVKHFGGGQTETKLELTPGSHTLQLILGDETHTPHQPPLVSEVVTITVQ